MSKIINKEISVSKKYAYLPYSKVPNKGNTANNVNEFWGKVKFHVFFSGREEQAGSKVNYNQPFQHRFFKARSPI